MTDVTPSIDHIHTILQQLRAGWFCDLLSSRQDGRGAETLTLPVTSSQREGERNLDHSPERERAGRNAVFNEKDLSKWRCPGVFRGIEFLNCPGCGEEVEFFPQDVVMACPGCGEEVTRRSSACILHCPAKQSFCYRQMVRSQALKQINEGGG